MAIGLIDIEKEIACRTAEASAIRSKIGEVRTLSYDFEGGKGFSTVIASISTGGVTPTGTKQISIIQNGTTTEDITNYASVEITTAVPGITNGIRYDQIDANGNPVELTVFGDKVADRIADYNTSLTTVNFTEDITRIGIQAFRAASNLSNIVIPYTCSYFGSMSFNSCGLLTSVRCGGTIEQGAFQNSGLTSVEFYTAYVNGVAQNTILNSDAFNGTYLTSIDLPESVVSLGVRAFANVPLEEIHLRRYAPGTVYSITLLMHGSATFNALATNCKIYVPRTADHAALNAYKTASNWVNYASLMEEEPE